MLPTLLPTSLFTAIVFSQYTSYEGKIIKHTKTKKRKQFEDTEQASEPDMTWILELPNQKFKTTVINMLMALMGKVDRIKNRYRQCKQSDGNP